MTRNEIIAFARARHPGRNWITAFAHDIDVSYWTIYRIAKNKQAVVSDLVHLKIEKLLRDEAVGVRKSHAD